MPDFANDKVKLFPLAIHPLASGKIEQWDTLIPSPWLTLIRPHLITDVSESGRRMRGTASGMENF